jgi:hypothetical protein
MLYGKESCDTLRSKLRIFGSTLRAIQSPRVPTKHPQTEVKPYIYLRHARDTTVECYSFATHKVEKFDKFKLLEG